MDTRPPEVPLVLTAPEVAAVVARLDGDACTPRRVRYLLSHRLAVDGARRKGQTRLYGPVDVALMRLAVRLQAQGLSRWTVRVVLVYSREILRDAWRSRAAVALVVRGVRGTIESAATATPGPADASVPLRPVWVGVERAIRRERLQRPRVWQWRAVPAAVLHAQAST
jgi:hypothetical protein